MCIITDHKQLLYIWFSHTRCLCLQRLDEKKRRIRRGEGVQHALHGRPSNNRKKPETMQQFVDFVKEHRVLDKMDGDKAVYRLGYVVVFRFIAWGMWG